jgi:hypothetical protein
MPLRRRDPEAGSLPVALLAVLVVGSLVTILVLSVTTGQRQTRFDQGFEQSLQLAETGLARMTQLVRSGQAQDDFTIPETAAAGGVYEGVADRQGRDWELTATGTAPNGTSRTITTTITWESVFGVAAFGRTELGLRGSTSADSFRSGSFDDLLAFVPTLHGSDICRPDGLPADPTNPADSSGTRMCNPTGQGVVATNGELFLLGQVINDVDRAEIHYAREHVSDPLPGATGFCAGVAETCASSKLAYFRDPIELEPNPVVPPGDLVNQGSFTGGTLPAGRQLYTNVVLDSDTVVQGTPENPTIVYVTGTLTVPNGAVVNFEQLVDGRRIPRPAPSLLVFSSGVGPALRFGNHASFAGAVYAPRAAFSGGAAGNIYGAMITASISTQGSWNFHYDDALGEVDTEAEREIRHWREE